MKGIKEGIVLCEFLVFKALQLRYLFFQDMKQCHHITGSPRFKM